MLHSIKVVLAAFVEGADTIDCRIRAGQSGTHACLVPDITKYGLDLADNPVRLYKNRFVRATDRNADTPASFGHAPRNIAPNKTRSAKDCDKFRHRRAFPASRSGLAS